MLQHFPPVVAKPLFGYLGWAKRYTVVRVDVTKFEQLFSFCPVSCTALTVSPLGRKLGLSKSFAARVSNSPHALEADCFAKICDTLISHRDKSSTEAVITLKSGVYVYVCVCVLKVCSQYFMQCCSPLYILQH
jgi:hypothetical protein